MTDSWRWLTPDFAPIGVRPVEPAADAPLLHAWLTHPRSHWWQTDHLDVPGVAALYAQLAGETGQDAWIGEVDHTPMFLIETYDPAEPPLGASYDPRPGDLGMHLLVAPPTGPTIEGLTDRAMAAGVRFCFEHRRARRIVVEPDVRNLAIHGKNAAAGFVAEATIALPGKLALLSMLTPETFRASRLGPLGEPRPIDVPHLRPDLMRRAHRLILAKALGEFTHEYLIEPVDIGPGPEGSRRYRLEVGPVCWEFTARRHPLNHWAVDPDSVGRHGPEPAGRVEAAALILDLADRLTISTVALPGYLEELNATVAARARSLLSDRPLVADLLDADLPSVESAMSEGHPCFVATNGRTGFTQADHLAYAPEAGHVAAPVWLGVRREVAVFRHAAGLSAEQAWNLALGKKLRNRLDTRLREVDRDPAEHHYLPVHPWQWQRHLGTTFAPDIARGDLIPLCTDPVPYRPQQSIRTWLPLDGRPYVKMALGIQNMGFIRGLSPAYLRVTPAINDYVAGIVRRDPELSSRGFDILTEFAAVGYTGDDFHRIGDANPHTKLLAALWRENPLAQLTDGERAFTMAALLHRDREGTSFCAALVRASGQAPAMWLRALLNVTAWPVLHLLAHHRLAFMPHGENVILRLRGHAPVGAWLKDIGEEAALFDLDTAVPARIERIRTVADDAEQARVIFCDVFDGFLRFLAVVWDDEGLLPTATFWREVATMMAGYVESHPEAGRLDLFTPEFEHTCLNRLQLRDPSRLVDLADQPGSLIRVGRLVNPMAGLADR